MNRCHSTVRKSLSVEPRSFFRCSVIPKTNHVFCQGLFPSSRQSGETTILSQQSQSDMSRLPKIVASPWSYVVLKVNPNRSAHAQVAVSDITNERIAAARHCGWS